ncbi:Lrp/AsnC family transcriptional regulator [Anaerolineales bacterium]|jgi:DNA-binding Lrp family transcriptional regulator
MKYYSQLDEIDKLILHALQIDSRLSNVEIARRVNLSPPAVHARIKRLEELGIIAGYRAILDPEMMGFDLMCFVQVRLQVHQTDLVKNFRTCIADIPEVLECYHLTGSVDYLIKVVLKNKDDLQRFLLERLTPIEGIARIQSSIVLQAIKTETALPIGPDQESDLS